MARIAVANNLAGVKRRHYHDNGHSGAAHGTLVVPYCAGTVFWDVMRQKRLANIAPNSEARDPLKSVLTAGRFILEWSEGVNEHRLWADKQKRAAVERQFEVIAAALIRLRDIDEQTWHRIDDAGTAIRLGEAIRKDYNSIDYGILWRATRNELPRMLQTVEDALALLRR